MSVYRQVLKINERDHVLTFGLEFLRELNKRRGMDIADTGLKGATGIHQALLDIKMQDPTVIKDFIEIGTRTNRVKPTNDEIEEYINNLYEDEDESLKDKVFENFMKAWRTLPGAKKIEATVKEAQAEIDAQKVEEVQEVEEVQKEK